MNKILLALPFALSVVVPSAAVVMVASQGSARAQTTEVLALISNDACSFTDAAPAVDDGPVLVGAVC